MKLSPWVSELKELARLGKIKNLIDGLSKIDPKTISREELIEYAHISRKARTPRKGALALFPNIKSGESISLEYQTAYAWCLFDLGLYNEVLRLFEKNALETPQVHLLMGKTYLKLWEVEASLPFLEAYFEKAKESSPQKQVAANHLLTCYRFLGFNEKLNQLIQNFPFPEKEMETQRALENSNIDKLNQIIEEFRQAGDVEHEREFSWYLTRLTRDQALFNKLIYGTLQPAFRYFISAKDKNGLVIEENYIRATSAETTRRFDLTNGKDSANPSVILKPGQVMHRLFQLVSAEQFGSIPSGVLFESLFPGETFDPELTTTKLHQIIRRFRNWLETSGLPVELKETSSKYQLILNPGYGLQFTKGLIESLHKSKLYHRTAPRLPATPFTVLEMAASLSVSQRFARKLLRQAVTEGWIKPVEAKRPIKYQILG